jgi:hypothetical protein
MLPAMHHRHLPAIALVLALVATLVTAVPSAQPAKAALPLARIHRATRSVNLHG